MIEDSKVARAKQDLAHVQRELSRKRDEVSRIRQDLFEAEMAVSSLESKETFARLDLRVAIDHAERKQDKALQRYNFDMGKW